MGQHFVVRRGRRLPAQLSALYMGADFVGQAMVTDLSLTGGRLLGTYPVKRGADLGVRVYLPDDERPVQIPRAVVRWSQGHDFGLELGPLPPSSRKRLREWIGRMAEAAYLVT